MYKKRVPIKLGLVDGSDSTTYTQQVMMGTLLFKEAVWHSG